MAKFRRKPQSSDVVEAVCWDGDNWEELKAFMRKRGDHRWTRETSIVSLGGFCRCGIGTWFVQHGPFAVIAMSEPRFKADFAPIAPLPADELTCDLNKLDALAELTFTAGPLRDACRALVCRAKGDIAGAEKCADAARTGALPADELMGLQNLLARIFRDGGHRQEEIGSVAKASEEAERVLVDERAEADELLDAAKEAVGFIGSTSARRRFDMAITAYERAKQTAGGESHNRTTPAESAGN